MWYPPRAEAYNLERHGADQRNAVFSLSLIIPLDKTKQILGRTRHTLSLWKTGSENEGHGQRASHGFGQNMQSRVPQRWWGHGGKRVMALMHEERRRLHDKGSVGLCVLLWHVTHVECTLL